MRRHVRPGARALTVLFLLGIFGVQGCASAKSTPPAAPARVTVNVPVITPQPQTQARQVKDGLEISVAPVTYTVNTKETVTFAPGKQTTAQWAWHGKDENMVYAERTHETGARIDPQRLQFLVTVNNQTPGVFKGAGAVVQFKVAGKLVAVDPRGYSNFTSAIIPPKQQQQIVIWGPPITALDPKGGAVGVLLYEVVTKQGDAGTAAGKQNYEWSFDCAMNAKQVEAPTKRVEPLRMYKPEYEKEMTEQERNAAQQPTAPVP